MQHVHPAATLLFALISALPAAAQTPRTPPLSDRDNLRDLLRGLEPVTPVTLQVRRADRLTYVTFTLD